MEASNGRLAETSSEEWPPEPLRRFRLQVAENGDVVVPATLVGQLGLRHYDVLLAWREGNELRLETVDSAYQKAREYFQSRVTTGYASDELIAMRRAEALLEIWE